MEILTLIANNCIPLEILIILSFLCSLNERAHLLTRVFRKTPSSVGRSNSVQQTVSRESPSLNTHTHYNIIEVQLHYRPENFYIFCCGIGAFWTESQDPDVVKRHYQVAGKMKRELCFWMIVFQPV